MPHSPELENAPLQLTVVSIFISINKITTIIMASKEALHTGRTNSDALCLFRRINP